MVENPFDIRLHEGPAAHVLRLFLAPQNFSALEPGQLGDERARRERIKLLQPHQVYILDAALFALFEQIEVDLAGAQHHALHLVVGDQFPRAVVAAVAIVPQNAMESGARAEILNPRLHTLVPEQRFRSHQDQRLAELPVKLTAQDMEVVGRSRAVRDLDIVLRAHLQEALQTRGGMFRPLPFIAVRQKHHQARHAQPLALARGDELVDRDLRAVDEVAELRFPQHQGVRLGEAVAVFETKHREFRQHRVDDLEARLLVGDVVERAIELLGFLIDDHRVALGKRAALAVLAGQANGKALVQQRGKRQRLGRRPVDTLARLDRLAPVLEDPLERAVRLHAFGDRGDLLADGFQGLDVDFGLAAARPLVGEPDTRPAPIQPVRAIRAIGIGGVELAFQAAARVGAHLVDLLAVEQPFLSQLVGVDVDNRAVIADALVHQRLGEGRLVALVVAVAAVAEHIDHHRLAEPLAEFRRHLRDMRHRLGIIAVHVEDRRFDHARDVRGIRRGAAEARRGREADLVVYDEVDRSAGAVAAKARQAEALRHDTLARKGRVAVQQQRQDRGAVAVVMLVLLGAHLAQHDRINRLQVRRVRRQRKMHLVAVERPVRGCAKVVFHVARALDLFGMRRAALELVKDRPVLLAHDV